MKQLLAWICLVLVATIAAYGLQLAVAVIAPSPTAAGQVTPAPPAHRVLIVAVDAVTGNREQTACEVPSDSYVNDLVLVDANDFPTVASACNGTDESGTPS